MFWCVLDGFENALKMLVVSCSLRYIDQPQRSPPLFPPSLHESHQQLTTRTSFRRLGKTTDSKLSNDSGKLKLWRLLGTFTSWLTGWTLNTSSYRDCCPRQPGGAPEAPGLNPSPKHIYICISNIHYRFPSHGGFPLAKSGKTIMFIGHQYNASLCRSQYLYSYWVV